MAKNEIIHIRIDEKVKTNAERILAMLGLTISEAVNIMLCQINLTGGLPFQVKLPAPENIIVNNKADIERKLNEAENDISNGNVFGDSEVFNSMEKKYI